MAVTGIAGGAGQSPQAVHNLNSDSNGATAQNSARNNQLRSIRTLTNQAGRNATATAEERGPGEAQEGAGAEAREANGAQAEQAQTTAQAGARLNLFA